MNTEEDEFRRIEREALRRAARDEDSNGRKYITTEPFKPDYNTEAVLVEEMQRMAKRIAELETEQDCVGWFGYDTGLRLWFEANKGDDGAIRLYTAPPQRQPLTDEEIENMDCRVLFDEHLRVVRMTEAAHNIGAQYDKRSTKSRA